MHEYPNAKWFRIAYDAELENQRHGKPRYRVVFSPNGRVNVTNLTSTIAIMAYSDGTAHRYDVPLSMAATIRTAREARELLGLPVYE